MAQQPWLTQPVLSRFETPSACYKMVLQEQLSFLASFAEIFADFDSMLGVANFDVDFVQPVKTCLSGIL